MAFGRFPKKMFKDEVPSLLSASQGSFRRRKTGLCGSVFGCPHSAILRVPISDFSVPDRFTQHAFLRVDGRPVMQLQVERGNTSSTLSPH